MCTYKYIYIYTQRNYRGREREQEIEHLTPPHTVHSLIEQAFVVRLQGTVLVQAKRAAMMISPIRETPTIAWQAITQC